MKTLFSKSCGFPSFVHFLRVMVLPMALLGMLLVVSAPLEASDPFNKPSADWLESVQHCSCVESDELGEALPKSFGPAAESRGTLFQWSYGTSFSGGPDINAPLKTDRPSFTAASTTVGLGVLQIESGYTYTADKSGTVTTRSNSAPEAAFRYGIFVDWLELRVSQNFSTSNDGFSRTSGAEDLYLGFKIGLTPQEGYLPEMALIPQMTVPSGSRDLTANEVLPGLDWIYAWQVNDFVSLTGSTQFNRAIDDTTANSYTSYAQSGLASFSLTESLGAYTEFYGLFPSSADTVKPQYYFDGGFTYLVSDDIQLDVRGGKGLNDAADDYFVGAGLSVRFR